MKSLLRIGLILTLAFVNGTAFASPTLSRDAQGRDVMLLQQQLRKIGYEITELDGEFGAETERAVMEFQRDQDLTVTGVVNNATWRALKKAKPGKRKAVEEKPFEAVGDDKLVPFGKVIISPEQAERLIATARQYMGVPYVFGGTTPSGFDCSGFLQYVFKENGLKIPRLADEQYELGQAVSMDELKAGDLVFFTTYEPGASHCGIYIGDGQFMHASSSRGIRIDRLDNAYWAPRYYGGKHIVY